MPLATGDVFAGYTVIRQLGAGGMGEVYLAQHPRLPRQDALKVLPAAVSADPQFRARFEREADLAAALWHPQIVGIHDRGEDDGRLWIAMDYVEGTDALQLVRNQYQQGVPADQVVEIVTAVAEALDYAHKRQLLHRDVKPANILLAHGEAGHRRILLADFGIARHTNDATGLTATNMTLGSVDYAAPEQLMGEPLDSRADQYALAATAFHLLTGASPFGGANAAVVIARHLTGPPPTLAGTRPLLAHLDPVLSRAMAKSPAERYESCDRFAAALAERNAGSAAKPTAVAALPPARPLFPAAPAGPTYGTPYAPPGYPVPAAGTPVPRLLFGVQPLLVAVLALIAVVLIAVITFAVLGAVDPAAAAPAGVQLRSTVVPSVP